MMNILPHTSSAWHWLLTNLCVMAGLITHTITRSYKNSAGTTLTVTETPTGNGEINFEQAVPIAANTNYVIKITRTQLKAMMIKSDQAITIFTNAASGGSPTDTIPVAAGQEMVWTLATDTTTAGFGLVKCPISADVTAGIWITNASAAVANVKIQALLAT